MSAYCKHIAFEMRFKDSKTENVIKNRLIGAEYKAVPNILEFLLNLGMLVKNQGLDLFN